MAPPLRLASRLCAARLATAAGVLLALAGASAGQPEAGARFAVTDKVINPDLPAVAATITGRGLVNGSNFAQGTGFEPVIFRNAFLVTRDAPDRVIAAPKDLSVWETLRNGALDGAEVDVWRIENGAFRLVRHDRVAPGGFHASSWKSYRPGAPRMIPAERNQAPLSWEPWYRRDAETWFMIRAVGADGTLSPPSEAVHARSPTAKKAGEKRPDALVRFDGRFKNGAGGPGAPRDLSLSRDPDGEPRLSWRPPESGPAPVGYAIFRSEDPPEEQKGYYLELEGGDSRPAVRKGDWVMIRKTFRDISQNGVIADRVWGAKSGNALRPKQVDFWPDETPGVSASLKPHAADTPVEDPGETYLDLKLGFGRSATLVGGKVGSVNGSWYEVLHPGKAYKVEAWLRSDRPGKAVFRFEGPGDYRKTIRPLIFPTGPQWRKVSGVFVPPRVLDKKMNKMTLTFNGPGEYSIDNFRIYRADAPYLGLLPEDLARLKSDGLSALRAQATSTTRKYTYDLAQLTSAGGVANSTQGGNTLPQLLGLIKQVGTDPWLTFEPHLTDDEWKGLVEYLAAPADAGPWAGKRARQGHPAPWTDDFGKIYIELGNETWNPIYSPWDFPKMTDAATGEQYSRGEVYGLFQQHVISVLRSSPWWKKAGLDDKVTFVLGGWNVNDYGIDAARRSPGSSMVTVAPYIFGWEVKKGPPEDEPNSYFQLLNWVSQNSIPLARRHARNVEKLSQRTGRELSLGTYEAGPGYVLRFKGKRLAGERNREQERVMKSQASGTATLDDFLAQAENGYGIQTFYKYGPGHRWNTYARWYKGGQDYPAWKLLMLLNREGLGDMVAVDALSVPGIDLTKGGHRRRIEDAPQVAAYATRRKDRLNLFVLSRRIPDHPDKGDSGCTPVEIDLPFKSADKVTLHRMAAPYDANNVDSDAVKIETLSVPGPDGSGRFAVDARTGGEACGLPPAASYLYVFEGLR